VAGSVGPYSVTATSSRGATGPAADSGTVQVVTRPDVPVLTVDASTAGTLTFDWPAVGDGGAALTSYTWAVDPPTGPTQTGTITSPGTSPGAVTLPASGGQALPKGTYTVTVTAYNAWGAGRTATWTGELP
jgi:hypothetical protein